MEVNADDVWCHHNNQKTPTSLKWQNDINSSPSGNSSKATNKLFDYQPYASGIDAQELNNSASSHYNSDHVQQKYTFSLTDNTSNKLNLSPNDLAKSIKLLGLNENFPSRPSRSENTLVTLNESDKSNLFESKEPQGSCGTSVSKYDWFYQDPQRRCRGPFTSFVMEAWYFGGYFDEKLILRRACDSNFTSLGELVKKFGKNFPFLASDLILWEQLSDSSLASKMVETANSIENLIQLRTCSLTGELQIEHNDKIRKAQTDDCTVLKFIDKLEEQENIKQVDLKTFVNAKKTLFTIKNVQLPKPHHEFMHSDSEDEIEFPLSKTKQSSKPDNMSHCRMKTTQESSAIVHTKNASNEQQQNNNVKSKKQQAHEYELEKVTTKCKILEKQLTRLQEGQKKHVMSIEVIIKTETLFGVLDNCAGMSCLGRGALKLLKRIGVDLKECVGEFHTIETVYGVKEQIIGYATTSVTYQGHTVDNFKFFVVPGFEVSLHLGSDFCRCFNFASCIPALLSPFDFGYSGKTLRASCEKSIHKLNVVEMAKLEKVKTLFSSFCNRGLGATSLESHAIDVGYTAPIQCSISTEVDALMYKELDKMIDCGVVKESSSSWNSTVIVVREQDTLRICLDLRRLNAVTKTDIYPMPRKEVVGKLMKSAKYISCIDLKTIFWQIPLDKRSQELTAFRVPGRPAYQFTRMPFGLANAPQRMCRLMDTLLTADLRSKTVVYLDFLLVFSEEFDSHIKLLENVAQHFKEANLTVNITRSRFCLSEVTYMGHIVGNGSFKADNDKCCCISNISSPTNLKNLNNFLQISNWYRRFINNYDKIVAPLLHAQRTNNEKLILLPNAVEAVCKIRRSLITQVVEPDFNRQLIIQCNASDTQVAGLLYQIDASGKECPITYYVKNLSKLQSQYSITELECLAVVNSLSQFRPYIEGLSFRVVTDQQILLWVMNQPRLHNRLARWSLEMQAFNFSVESRKDNRNVEPFLFERIDDIVKCRIERNLRDPNHIYPEYKNLMEGILSDPSQHPDHKVVDKLIYIRRCFSTGDAEIDRSVWKLWIPHNLAKSLMDDVHKRLLGPHRNKSEMHNILRTEYYFPWMTSRIANVISNCKICMKPPRPLLS